LHISSRLFCAKSVGCSFLNIKQLLVSFVVDYFYPGVWFDDVFGGIICICINSMRKEKIFLCFIFSIFGGVLF
jgi:hypothetical protein